MFRGASREDHAERSSGEDGLPPEAHMATVSVVSPPKNERTGNLVPEVSASNADQSRDKSERVRCLNRVPIRPARLEQARSIRKTGTTNVAAPAPAAMSFVP